MTLRITITVRMMKQSKPIKIKAVSVTKVNAEVLPLLLFVLQSVVMLKVIMVRVTMLYFILLK